MPPKAPKIVEPPSSGLWRVGRSPAPLRFSDPLEPGLLAVRATPEPSRAIPAIRFLDIEAAQTRAVLRNELGELLAYYGFSDLDVATVRGGDRRITRWIGRWAHEQRDAEGRLKFAGIRYLSRLSSEWECWALFEDVALEEQERRPIARDDQALTNIADLYGLTVF